MNQLKYFICQDDGDGFRISPPKFWATVFCLMVVIGMIIKWIKTGIETADFIALMVNGGILLGVYTWRKNTKDKIISE